MPPIKLMIFNSRPIRIKVCGKTLQSMLLTGLMNQVGFAKSLPQTEKTQKWDQLALLYGQETGIPHSMPKSFQKLRSEHMLGWARRVSYVKGRRSDIQKLNNVGPEQAEMEMTQEMRLVLQYCDDIPDAGSEFDSDLTGDLRMARVTGREKVFSSCFYSSCSFLQHLIFSMFCSFPETFWSRKNARCMKSPCKYQDLSKYFFFLFRGHAKRWREMKRLKMSS